MNRVNSIFLIFQLFIIGCSANNREITGTYAAIGYVNTQDTIVLRSDGVYERKVYDSKNRLVLKMEGDWKYKDDLLTMRSFFLNLDQNVSLYPEILKDTAMRMEVLLERGGKNTRFCTGYLRNENCYEKISN